MNHQTRAPTTFSFCALLFCRLSNTPHEQKVVMIRKTSVTRSHSSGTSNLQYEYSSWTGRACWTHQLPVPRRMHAPAACALILVSEICLSQEFLTRAVAYEVRINSFGQTDLPHSFVVGCFTGICKLSRCGYCSLFVSLASLTLSRIRE